MAHEYMQFSRDHWEKLHEYIERFEIHGGNGRRVIQASSVRHTDGRLCFKRAEFPGLASETWETWPALSLPLAQN